MSKSDKSVLAESKRSKRLLQLLPGKQVLLQQSTKENILLLVVVGERTVKCHASNVAKWLSAGYVEIRAHSDGGEAHLISITDIGAAYLKRSEKGDFADQHREKEPCTIQIDKVKHRAERNINESPLSALFHRRTDKSPWLNIDQFNAGERLRSDFDFSQLAPSISASWDPTSSLNNKHGGRKSDDCMNDRVLGARQRLNRAIDAVGPEFSGILLDVCCFLKGMEQVERERQWPRRSAKLLLKAALSALARHYTPQNNSRRHSDIQHWATADNRPKI